MSTSVEILEAVPIAAGLLRADGVVLYANALLNELFEAKSAGQHLNLFLRSPAVSEAFERARLEGHQTEARNVARSNTSRTIDVTFAPLASPAGTPQRFLVTCTDITREQMVERMRSDFVANASHELRTPLTTLSGFIETMQGAANKDEKARGEFLKLMKAQADRMARLIDDLLSLSRIELDEHVPPHETVNLSAVVEQARSLLQATASANGCTLTVTMPPRLMVKGDNGQLGQVLHNLMENALKYAGQGKDVVVSGRSANGIAIVSVQDNGPGIAAHHVPRLTERFYRVNVQDSRTRGGTGLGLAICKHIINRHRGRLLIESEPGHGSVFSVHIPES